MKYNIVLYTEGLQFNGGTINEVALGGSESAFTYLAREFARLGHNVTAFTRCGEGGLFDGVAYIDVSNIQNFLQVGECDIFIASRFPEVFASHIPAKVKILWNHDLPFDVEKLSSLAYGIDYMYCLSQFHKNEYLRSFPDFEKIIKLTTNAVDDSIIPKNSIKKHQIIFTSRPERGLFDALRMFHELGDKTLKFIVCYYPTIDNDRTREIEKGCLDYIKKLRDEGYQIEVAQFPKAELLKNISESKCVLYPTDWPEISCINAIEAQACGTCFITYNKFALSETVEAGGLSDSIGALFDKLKLVVSDEVYRQSLEKAQYLHSKKYRWSGVAAQFIKDAEDFLARKQENKRGVFDRLIYNSDILAARHYVNTEYPEGKAVVDRYFLPFQNENTLADFYDSDYSNRVIGERQKASEYYIEAAKLFNLDGAKRILDFACSTGFGTASLKEFNPDAEVVGYDISKNRIEFAKNNYDNSIIYTTEAPQGQFDALYAGEVLEHVDNPTAFIEHIESYVKDGGRIYITIPRGAWEWLSRNERLESNHAFEHVSGFDLHDIVDLFAGKLELSVNSTAFAGYVGSFGEQLGHYLITYKKSDATTGKIDYDRKIKLTRPYPRISACIIAKNAEKDIEHCIESIRDIVDEIVVIDDQSTDKTVERAKRYTDKVFIADRTICAPDFKGFAEARNEAVDKSTGDWIFWIDTDERFKYDGKVRHHLEGDLINAFIIPQHHAQLDNFIEADRPSRLYRRETGRFVGYIHEQAMAVDDMNKCISPAIILTGAHILHFGSITEDVRAKKAYSRNLKLLEIDCKENPHRILNKILVMRDFVNKIKGVYQRHGHLNTDEANFAMQCINGLWKKFFKTSESNEYKILAYKQLQEAMQWMNEGLEIKLGISVNPNRTSEAQTPKAAIYRVYEEDLDEFFNTLKDEVKEIAKLQR